MKNRENRLSPAYQGTLPNDTLLRGRSNSAATRPSPPIVTAGRRQLPQLTGLLQFGVLGGRRFLGRR